jgi:LacI family transcriptional regulator
MAKPTRLDIARAAGVAESTVSRALQDSPLITDAVKKRVRDLAVELGYVPSRQAALFASKRTYTLGYVVPSYGSFTPFSRSYFPTLLDGLVIRADELGYSITIILDKVYSDTRDYMRLVHSRTVDGLLFAVTHSDDKPFQSLREENVPFVLINNYADGLTSVDARPESGMRKAFAHAVSLGHRAVGYVAGDEKYKNAVDRLKVFEALAAEHGVAASVTSGDFSRTSGYRGAEALLAGPRPPSVIMTSSDRAAFGVIQFAGDHGLSIPRDLSVIGYDDFYPASTSSPPLTTVSQPVLEMGKLAISLLVDDIEGRQDDFRQEFLETDFVVRKSTSAPGGAA